MSFRSSHISVELRRRVSVSIAILAAALPVAAQPRAFSAADAWEWRDILGPRISPDAAYVAYLVRTPLRQSNSFETRLWLAPTSGSAAPRPFSPAGSSDSSPRWSPESDRVAWLSAGDGRTVLRVRAVSGAAETVIPAAGATAFAWSPDGALLAYTAQVSEPLPNSSWAPPALLPQLRAFHTRLFLVRAAGGDATPVPLGNLEPAAEPAFFADGRGLLLSLAAPSEAPDLYTLRLPDFALRRITTRPGPDLEPVPSPDGSRIAWLARDPAHTAKLWVANPDGSRARTLAGALDRDPGRPWWSSDSRTLYFIAEDRGQARVYAARNDGSARAVLSAASLRDLSLADSGRAAAVRDPGELVLFAADLAGQPRVLVAPNRELLAGRVAASVEPFEYKAGTFTIQAWLTRPPGFDAARKYPVLLDIDDAPRRMCGPAFSLRSQVFAAAGMIVLCANARGAPGYGEAFGNVIRTGFPGDPVDDWMAGVDALAAQPCVDAARLRIAGGVSAVWAIGHTKRFQSAVTRRAVVDLALDTGSLGVLPWEDPGYFAAHSPMYFLGAIATPTLILAPPGDPGASQLAFALASRKVEHAVLRIGEGPPGDLVAEWEATVGWFGR